MSTADATRFAALFGRDLALDYTIGGGFYEDADLVPALDRARVDIARVEGVENLTQALADRLKTRAGELTPLGHPEYGSRHHDLVGEPNTERVRQLVKLFVLQALRHEPRIERVLAATVRAEHSPPRDTVRIELTLQVIGAATPINLVVPFSLSGGLGDSP